MATPSSTSSSETRPDGARAPWALLLALVLVLALEAALHCVPVERAIPYELGAEEYRAAASYLMDIGPAEVSVVGSSRAREAFVMPELRRIAGEAAGRPVTVANYACAGGTASEVEALVRMMLRQRAKPRLVLYGMTHRQYHSRGMPQMRATFWNWDDWRAQAEHRNLWPHVLRNSIGRHCLALRYRTRLRQVCMGKWTDTPPAPMRGELTPWQRDRPDDSLPARLANPEFGGQVERYVERLLVDGDYPLDPGRVASAERTVEMCRAAGVEVALVEVPTSPVLVDHLPAGTRERFLAETRALADRHGVRFLALDALPTTFGNDAFREQSHLNRAGAERFTRFVADLCVTLAPENPDDSATP